MRILVIEDNEEINGLLKELLLNDGYEVGQAYSGSEGLLLFGMQPFDLVLLDLMLPGMKGEDVLKKIREKSQVPVIIISAKSDIDGKVDLLTSGANDYITKPFDVREVSARVAIALRTRSADSASSGICGSSGFAGSAGIGGSSGASGTEGLCGTSGFSGSDSSDNSSSMIRYEELALDPETHRFLVNDNEVTLTRLEFGIVKLLLNHPKKVYTKEELFELAWDDIYVGDDKTINVHISNIRKKIRQFTEKEYIRTVWGIGFTL